MEIDDEADARLRMSHGNETIYRYVQGNVSVGRRHLC